jgi:hypothetical protein
MARKPKVRDDRLPPWRADEKRLDPLYKKFAEEAAACMTPNTIKRGKRIQEAGAADMLVEAKQLFERGVRQYGAAAARDVFQQAIEIVIGPPIPAGRSKGARDPERDKSLLELWLAAKRGEIPGGKPMTKMKFAKSLGPHWGFKNPGEVLRRLRYLQAQGVPK